MFYAISKERDQIVCVGNNSDEVITEVFSRFGFNSSGFFIAEDIGIAEVKPRLANIEPDPKAKNYRLIQLYDGLKYHIFDATNECSSLCGNTYSKYYHPDCLKVDPIKVLDRGLVCGHCLNYLSRRGILPKDLNINW